MAIICREHNLLFIMTPRTACSAVGKVLREELSGEWLPSQHIFNTDGSLNVRRKHSSLEELVKGGVITLEESKKLIKVAAVRNPFDSLVSLYVKKKTKYAPQLNDPSSGIHNRPRYVEDMKFCQNHSFEDWIIKNHSFYRLKKFLRPKSYHSMFKVVEGVDEIIHFENIQDEFNEVLKKHGVSFDLKIPLYNVTTERNCDYRKYYTSKTRSIVEYFYQKDLEKYNYQF